MPLSTELFTQFPWVGGLNTSQDPSTIEPNELVQADHLVFGVRGSRKKRDGIDFSWDDQSNTSVSVLALKDFWYGTTSRTQARVGICSDKTIYSYTGSGVRSADLFGGTAWGSAITRVSTEVLNNLLIVAVDGTSNVMKKWTGSGNFADLGVSPPQASICRVHKGRLFTNDKTNVDRLHYSPIQDPESWNGAGDSGAIPIGLGDGDPEGITAIFPTFKGNLFVAKRTKLYRVVTDGDPVDWTVELVSSGVGCVSHNSVVAVDQDDMMFVSERGFHTLAATTTFGDFSSTFLSASIQQSFNNDFTRSRLKFIQGVYLPEINSVAWAVTDEDVSASYNGAIWLYNLSLKAWYRWPDIACESIGLFRDSDQLRLYIGTNSGRVAKAFNGTVYDVNTSGTNTAIPMILKTGRIFPGVIPFSEKGFKRFSLIYGPEGAHTITASLVIDAFPAQSLAFNETIGDTLDGTFILDQSYLAGGLLVAPYSFSIDGYGRSFELTLYQSGVNERCEIQGFMIEYEQAGLNQEVVNL